MARGRRAPWQAVDTWSSWLAEVGIESTEAGCDICLFPAVRAADVTSAIMKPGFSPGFGVRKTGRPQLIAGSTSMATRRWAMAPVSQTAIAISSAAKATGPAWKFPPETTRPSPRTSGLSVAALASVRSVPAAIRRRSRPAPATCGGQRMQQGSCTLSSPSMWLARMAEPASRRDSAAAVSIGPRSPRSAWISGSKGAVEPIAASDDIAPVTSEATSPR